MRGIIYGIRISVVGSIALFLLLSQFQYPTWVPWWVVPLISYLAGGPLLFGVMCKLDEGEVET